MVRSRTFSIICSIIFVLTVLFPSAQANSPPVADAGDDQEVKVGRMVLFGASDSYDPDGDSLAYSWDFDDSNGIQTDSNLLAPRHTYDTAGHYIVTLTVSDGLLGSTDTILVKVDPDLPPIVDLGPDIETSVNERFFLDSRNVSDPNGDSLKYSWDFDASDGIQEDSTEKLPTWRYSQVGRFTVTLTVSDGQFTSNGTLNVTVVESMVPVSGKKFDHTGTLAPGKKMTYWTTISKGKGLKVTIKSTNGKDLDTYLFESTNFYTYVDTGDLVAISEGSKEGTTSFSYTVKIPKTDDYHIMIRNPSTVDMSYKITIEVISLGTGSKIPGFGSMELALALMTLIIIAIPASRRN